MQPSKEPSDFPENPYAPPPLSPAETHTIAPEYLERSTLRAFVGAKADYYLSKWAPLLTGRGRDAGFNWAAFFLSGLWLPYRKMYKVSAIFFGIIILESLAEEVLFVGILGKPETPAGFERMAGLVASIVCGAFGNRWYLSHAKNSIAAIRAGGLEPQSQLQLIARRGGTSLLASFGVFILFLISMVAIFAAWEFAFGSGLDPTSGEVYQ